MATVRPMKPIPISAAGRIAKDYGYDQVIVIARRVGDEPAPHGEHVTTYGVNAEHCTVAARIGDFLKLKVMGWQHVAPITALKTALESFLRLYATAKESRNSNTSFVDTRDLETVAAEARAALKQADTTTRR